MDTNQKNIERSKKRIHANIQMLKKIVSSAHKNIKTKDELTIFVSSSENLWNREKQSENTITVYLNGLVWFAFKIQGS